MNVCGTLISYGQLIIENSRIERIQDDLLDQIFNFMIRDFSKYALQLYSKTGPTRQHPDLCMKMIRKPLVNRLMVVIRNHPSNLNNDYSRFGSYLLYVGEELLSGTFPSYKWRYCHDRDIKNTQ